MKPKRNGKLTKYAQEYAVCALACFETPSVVAKALKSEFGVSITPQSVQAYDPTKRAGARLSEYWRKIFETTRNRFLQETADIPIAHRAVRLRSLQRMAEQAERQKKYSLAARLLEQAAREMGNAFTNHRVISGPANSPVRFRHEIPPGATVIEAQDAWQALLQELPPP